MAKVHPLARGAKSNRRPASTLLDRAFTEATPGQALRAIMLAAKRLGWVTLLPIPPDRGEIDPNDEVVGLVTGRAAYVGHVERHLGAAHREAYRLGLGKEPK